MCITSGIAWIAYDWSRKVLEIFILIQFYAQKNWKLNNVR